jgi:ribosomal protein S18 acetylase RimI-like enzyme
VTGIADGPSGPAHPDLAAGLGLRMDQNLAEHACYLHRGTPGMSVRQAADLIIADSGLDDDSFNFVGSARFTAATATARIAATMGAVQATGLPFAWHVGPSSAPAELPALLAEAGMPAAEDEAAMWTPLRAVGPPGASVPGARLPGADPAARPEPSMVALEIREVRSPAELRDWAWVLAAASDPPALTVVEFFARTARQVLAADCPARLLVGYYEGRPVCTADVLVHAGVAGLYNISTLATYQRRGFGTAITVAAMRAAHRLGADTAILQASEQGEPVYRKLGFAACSRVTVHSVTP